MLNRADILKSFKLQDRVAFEIYPHRDDNDIWKMKVSHEGDPTILISLGAAKRLADEIRPHDHQLAVHLDACLEIAQRYSEN